MCSESSQKWFFVGIASMLSESLCLARVSAPTAETA